MDEAWADLIKRRYKKTLLLDNTKDRKCSLCFIAMVLKISKDELDRLGETSISFRDGSGYLAEMGVFHELHCVVRTFL